LSERNECLCFVVFFVFVLCVLMVE
jgi:hypothetical protein